MSNLKFLMTVVRVNERDGEVLLMSLADQECPCEMRWSYSLDAEILDAVGESYLVSMEQVSEKVKT